MIKSHSATLREAIEEMIAVGALSPGQHLDETELATRFGVSRTPIRETLIQLASMGLVVIRPRRGAIVAELAPQEQQVLLDAHRACMDARDAQEPDDYYYKNELFHEAIYAGSHNQFLIEQARNLYRRLRPYRRLQLRVRDRLGKSYEEHDGVVNAIIDGDGELAARLLREHVMIQGQRFADLMASLPQLGQQAAG